MLPSSIRLDVTPDEASGLKACVIEALEALTDDAEFATRVGLSRPEAEGLLRRISGAVADPE